MIEVSNSRQEPAGWVDDYGNFERIAQDWMEEEPGTTWRPVFFEEPRRVTASRINLEQPCASATLPR